MSKMISRSSGKFGYTLYTGETPSIEEEQFRFATRFKGARNIALPHFESRLEDHKIKFLTFKVSLFSSFFTIQAFG